MLLATVAWLVGCAEPSEPKPDVFLITLDTTRADHLSVYGYARKTSPSLERFARDSVIYRHAWATGAWTLPTHASMITGRQVSNHGARFVRSDSNVDLSQVLEGDFFAKHKANRLPDDEVTLAELLLEAGYTTAAFAGGPWLAPPFGLMQGYQLADTEVRSALGRTAEELTDHLIEWLDSQPPNQPVHALINYFDPHSPWEPIPPFDDFPAAKLPLDEKQDAIYINGGVKLRAAERRIMIDRYDGEIRYMDSHLGRLFEALKQQGRYDDALIIVVGDHGELFGEHGVVGHGRWLYEGVLRIPLLIHFPHAAGAGTRVDAPVSQVDLLPLIASELPLVLPENIDGVPIGSRSYVFAEAFRDPFSVSSYGKRFDRDLVALVQWPWKLISSDTGTREIFNLDTDPAERRSQSKAPARSSLERSLTEVVDGLHPRLESTPPSEISPELRENLRELGYIE